MYCKERCCCHSSRWTINNNENYYFMDIKTYLKITHGSITNKLCSSRKCKQPIKTLLVHVYLSMKRCAMLRLVLIKYNVCNTL